MRASCSRTRCLWSRSSSSDCRRRKSSARRRRLSVQTDMRLRRLRSWPNRLQMRRRLLMPSCPRSRGKLVKLLRRRPIVLSSRLRRRRLKRRLRLKRKSGTREKKKSADLKKNEFKMTKRLAIKLELRKSLKRKRLRINCRQQQLLLLRPRAKKSSRLQSKAA